MIRVNHNQYKTLRFFLDLTNFIGVLSKVLAELQPYLSQCQKPP